MKVSGISFSSDRKLARCEQQYSYNYEEKLQLKRKKIALFRGDLGHQLVQAHYDKTGWKKKFDELTATRWTPLFDEEKEEYGLDFMSSLSDLMEHYEEHWSGWDKNWEILHVEQDFSIMTKEGWPVRWKADLVVKEEIKTSTARRIKGHEQYKIVLVEHKFKKSIPESDERILQPQVHSYAWLLGKKGIKVESILWDYIRTEPVPRPQILKAGGLSIRKIKTDRRGYLKSLREAKLYPINEADLIGLENTMRDMPETLSLERVPNSVNFKMGEQFVRDWLERAKRAEKIDRPLRNWSRNCKFDCDYYKLCQVDMRGDTDRNFIILKDFEKKAKREEETK